MVPIFQGPETRVLSSLRILQGVIGFTAMTPSHLRLARNDAVERKIVSPEILPDRRVIFRLQAPQARHVAVVGLIPSRSIPLVKGIDGIWSATFGPLSPGIYQYSFTVDSLSMIDPGNPDIKPTQHPRMSILAIPAKPPALHDWSDIPHGTLHHHWYRSTSLGAVRSIAVYTPPDYEFQRKRYPTLYLLPGSGDTETTWAVYGRVNMLLDNLIHRNRAVPMVVVMVDGQAVLRRAPRTIGNLNTEALRRDLVTDVVPLIERIYRVDKRGTRRAIFGVSKGGGQALIVGLLSRGVFAWVGGMSSAVLEHKTIMARALSEPTKTNRSIRLVWLGCGESEDLWLRMNAKLRESLTAAGIRHKFMTLPGSHGWPLWRSSFVKFASTIFVERQ